MSETPIVAQKPEVDPALQEFYGIRERRRDLQKRIDEIVAELKPLNAQIAKLGELNQPPAPPKPAQPMSERVKSLIGNVAKLPVPKEQDPPRIDLSAEPVGKARALSDELKATNEAIDALLRFEFEARLTASRSVCALRLAEYSDIASRIAGAAAELADALIEHDEFTISVADAGLSWSFVKPIPVARLGDDIFLRISDTVKAANQLGHSDVETSAIRQWSQHKPHRLDPAVRRPEKSQARAAAPAAFRTDARLASPAPQPRLAARVTNERVIAQEIRKR